MPHQILHKEENIKTWAFSVIINKINNLFTYSYYNHMYLSGYYTLAGLKSKKGYNSGKNLTMKAWKVKINFEMFSKGSGSIKKGSWHWRKKLLKKIDFSLWGNCVCVMCTNNLLHYFPILSQLCIECLILRMNTAIKKENNTKESDRFNGTEWEPINQEIWSELLYQSQ